MTRPLAINRLLSAADHDAFDAYLSAPSTTLNSAHRWLLAHGYVISRPACYNYMLARNPNGRPRHPQRFLKVDFLLSENDRLEYEKFLRSPQATCRSAAKWLKERGYHVGMNALLRHRPRFMVELDETKRSARFAADLAAVAREHGGVTMSEGALIRVEQLVMEQLIDTDAHKKIPPDELLVLAKTVSRIVASRYKLEAMRHKYEGRARRAAAEAEKVANKGGGSLAVVNRMRSILGLPPYDPNHPSYPAPPEEIARMKEKEKEE